MSTYDFPSDLIEIQRDYQGVDARVHEIADALPSSVDIIQGRAEQDPALDAALTAARAERLNLLEALIGHSWWRRVDDVPAAKLELRKAAAGAG